MVLKIFHFTSNYQLVVFLCLVVPLWLQKVVCLDDNVNHI